MTVSLYLSDMLQTVFATSAGSGVLRTAAYCRVSTASEKQEGSYEMQKAFYEELIASRPYLVPAGIYGDPGKSGRETYGRDGLQRMLRDCEDGKIDLILCKSISRFSRNMGECIGMVRHLKAIGVRCIFEKEGFDTGDMTSEILLCILAAIAEEESQSISCHLRTAYKMRAIAGRPSGAVPYGYRRGWIICESEARRVRTAFACACRGSSPSAICAVLQKMEEADRTGKVWTCASVSYLLRNERYKGDVLTNKTVEVRDPGGRKRKVVNDGLDDQIYIDRHHEPLIPAEVFDTVQKLLDRKLLSARRRKKMTKRDVNLLARAETILERNAEDMGL